MFQPYLIPVQGAFHMFLRDYFPHALLCHQKPVVGAVMIAVVEFIHDILPLINHPVGDKDNSKDDEQAEANPYPDIVLIECYQLFYFFHSYIYIR